MARIRCPRITCKSYNCVPVSQEHKYKVGKGVVGAVVGEQYLVLQEPLLVQEQD